jgi:hypothetical protein
VTGTLDLNHAHGWDRLSAMLPLELAVEINMAPHCASNQAGKHKQAGKPTRAETEAVTNPPKQREEGPVDHWRRTPPRSVPLVALAGILPFLFSPISSQVVSLE